MAIPEPNYPIPIFTIYVKGGGEIKIYANGLVEGAVEVQGICNHLPLLLDSVVMERFSKRFLGHAEKSDGMTATVRPVENQ